MSRTLLLLVTAAVQVSAQIAIRINDGPPVQIGAEEIAKLPKHSAVLGWRSDQF